MHTGSLINVSSGNEHLLKAKWGKRGTVNNMQPGRIMKSNLSQGKEGSGPT